jgi:hypothetical protein
MNRREVIAGLMLPLFARSAWAQKPMRRIGVLMDAGEDLEGRSWVEAFRRGLAKLGWGDGREVQLDVRWGGADIEHIRANATDLASSKPDVILVYAVRVLNAMRQAT